MPIRENRFARNAGRITKNIARDEGLTVDQQLTRLEEDIRRLKVEFDIFMFGSGKRAPYDTRNRVESQIKRIGDDRKLTFAQRYFYNTLVARFTAFREMWRRTMQGREDGRDAFSTARATQRAGASESIERSLFVCDDAHRDVTTVRQLYDALIEAKERCGEATSDLSFPRFHHLIATKTDKLKETLGCERVLFSVGVEEGRVNFKAKADNDE